MLEKEVEAPKGKTERPSALLILGIALVTLFTFSLLVYKIIDRVENPSLLMEKVPTTHEVESVNSEPAWQGRNVNGSSVYAAPPKKCMIYRGSYVMSKEMKGRWVLTRYLESVLKRERECPLNTLFLVRKFEIKYWSEKYERISEDEADKAYLINSQH